MVAIFHTNMIVEHLHSGGGALHLPVQGSARLPAGQLLLQRGRAGLQGGQGALWGDAHRV